MRFYLVSGMALLGTGWVLVVTGRDLVGHLPADSRNVDGMPGFVQKPCYIFSHGIGGTYNTW